ncbi:MAG: hypothetical protein H6Q37_109 [Chloroflexi bacterium]|jgi:hypothetical protein|nr:hypothetical protein [Chloroflexota bacterium]
MNDDSPFLILDQPCDQAIEWLSKRVTIAGLHIVRTFDLQTARSAHPLCTCPHHGTDQCDCQMVVLLVYGFERQPVSIVVHGHDGQTWFSVVDIPQQHVDPCLESVIMRSIILQNEGNLNVPNQFHTD